MSLPEYDAALGRIPSGVYILTIGAGSDATGMLASWVMQAGFDPPRVSVAIKTGRHVAERVLAGEAFVLNILGEGQTALLKHFGKGFEPGEPAFTGIEIQAHSSGVLLLADCVGHLVCRRSEHLATGDHTIVLAEVLHGGLANQAAPMIHVRKSGRHY